MRIFGLLFLAILCFTTSSHGANPDAILGVWTTADKDAKIEFYKCGSEYCGKMVFLEEPNFPSDDKEGMAGQPRVDRYNPDPKLRNRPLLGMTFIEGFRYTGDNTWKGGRIYDPEDGKTYNAVISVPKEDRLELRGYLGIPLLGRTETWTR